MAFTTGNDTVSVLFGDQDIDGLAGDDLLILTVPTTYMGFRVNGVSLNATLSDATLVVRYVDETGQFAVSGETTITIRNVERFDVTVPGSASGGLYSGAGNDTLRGGTWIDFLFGGGGSNVMFGGAGDDRIHISEGATVDRAFGGADSDFFFGAGLEDIIDGGPGVDSIQYSLGSQTTATVLDLQSIYTNTNWSRVEVFDVFLTAQNDILRATEIRGIISGGAGDDDVLVLNRTGLSAIRMDIPSSQSQIYQFERFRFIGGDQADYILAPDGNDTLGGGRGNDTLFSGGGRDEIYGGAGNDLIRDVDFSDTVGGGAGHDVAYVDFSASATGLTLGQGQAPANYSGIEEYAGVLSRHDDTYSATFISRAGGGIDGSDGFDRLILDFSHLSRGFTGVLALLQPPSGSVLLLRPPGVVGQEGASARNWEVFDLTGSNGNDDLRTGNGDDVLRGMGGNDSLWGGSGNNEVYGGRGNDLITIDAGSVTHAYGGTGNDTFRVEGTGHIIDGDGGHDRVEINLGDMSAGITLSIRGVDGTWRGIENVFGSLTGLDDTANLGFALGGGPGAFPYEKLYGGGGTDTLILDYSAPGRAGSVFVGTFFYTVTLADGTQSTGYFESFEVIHATGTAKGDVLNGGTVASRLFALGGNDTLTGGYGRDYMDGGVGDDSLSGNFDNDVLDGGDGDDTLNGGNGFDSLDGGGDHDTLRGGGGDDLIFGEFGHDLIQAGDGLDAIEGGGGNDHIFGGLGADLFFYDGIAASGNDRIADYVEGTDILWISGGTIRRNLTIVDVGDDLLVTWQAGTALLQGMAGQIVRIYFDADFV